MESCDINIASNRAAGRICSVITYLNVFFMMVLQFPTTKKATCFKMFTPSVSHRLACKASNCSFGTTKVTGDKDTAPANLVEGGFH